MTAVRFGVIPAVECYGRDPAVDRVCSLYLDLIDAASDAWTRNDARSVEARDADRSPQWVAESLSLARGYLARACYDALLGLKLDGRPRWTDTVRRRRLEYDQGEILHYREIPTEAPSTSREHVA